MLKPRRAELFERAMSSGAAAPEVADLVSLVDELPRPRPAVDAAFRVALHDQLVAAARERAAANGATNAVGTPGGARARGPRSPVVELEPGRSRRAAAAWAVASVLVVAGGGTALASASAVPGDALYPVKRGVEQLRVSLASGDENRGTTYLAIADQRLAEAERLVSRGDPAGADAALQSFGEDFSEAERLLVAAHDSSGGPAGLTQLAAFAADAGPRLVTLQGRSPSLSGRIAQLLALLHSDSGVLGRLVSACGPPCSQSPGLTTLGGAGPASAGSQPAGSQPAGSPSGTSILGGPAGPAGSSPSAPAAVTGPLAGLSGPVAGTVSGTSTPSGGLGVEVTPLPAVPGASASVGIGGLPVVGGLVVPPVAPALPGAAPANPAPNPPPAAPADPGPGKSTCVIGPLCVP